MRSSAETEIAQYHDEHARAASMLEMLHAAFAGGNLLDCESPPLVAVPGADGGDGASTRSNADGIFAGGDPATSLMTDQISEIERFIAQLQMERAAVERERNAYLMAQQAWTKSEIAAIPRELVETARVDAVLVGGVDVEVSAHGATLDG